MTVFPAWGTEIGASSVTLNAIGWDHPRCRGPMLAAAAAWRCLHPSVSIEWAFRPLAEFNDQPLVELSERFDLLVVDHPYAGAAAEGSLLARLEELVPLRTLTELAGDAVGSSHASYAYAGSQWALAADAACQVAAVRDDLLAAEGRETPRTWEEVLELAVALPGRVALPLYPTDAFCCVLTLCASLGAPAGHGHRCFPDEALAQRSLTLLAELAPNLHAESAAFNPPRALDRMQQSDEIAYVPLAFGYTNYARPGASRIGPDEPGPRHPTPNGITHRPPQGLPRRIRFLPPPAFPGHPVRSLLGGAGIAVSASSRHAVEAAAFAAWVCGRDAQARIVFPAGGQPASRTAWLDREVDAAAGGFFAATLATIEAAHVRPREAWWPLFQEEAGRIVTGFLAGRVRLADVVAELEQAFERARSRAEKRAA